MTARPILMSAPMVQALLAGRKTQTRRHLKVQPPSDKFVMSRMMESTLPAHKKHEEKLHWVRTSADKLQILESDERYFHCPFGGRGESLWVRETFAACLVGEGMGYNSGTAYIYKSDCEGEHLVTWTPSMFMPRQASRLTLEITNIRVERLQDISGEDAEAEGVFKHLAEYSIDKVFRDKRSEIAIEYYRELWESINGKGSWAENPWVWVIEFKAHQQNVDEFLAGKRAHKDCKEAV